MSTTITTTCIVLAPSYDIATCPALLLNPPTVTVEAEYGMSVVEGTHYTAAHHVAAYHHRPAPCNDTDIPYVSDGTVLLSHLDLDAIGGALRTQRRFSALFRPKYNGFWNLVEFVDVHGLHTLYRSDALPADKARLHAWIAWATDNVPTLSACDLHPITHLIERCGNVLARILSDDEELIADGAQHVQDAEYAFNLATRVAYTPAGILIRHVGKAWGDQFANHLYDDLQGGTARAVVCYHWATRTITMSLAQDSAVVSCAEVLQVAFGDLAGGHASIAGSPRGQRMTLEDVNVAVELLETLLEATASEHCSDTSVV